MNVLDFLNKAHISARLLSKAMKNDPSLKDEMKDYIKDESLKTGIRVGKIYVAALNDIDKITQTIHLFRETAATLNRMITVHKQDFKSYVGGSITNTVKSIVTEIENEKPMPILDRITAAMIKEKEESTIAELSALTKNSLNEINLIKGRLEVEIRELNEMGRDIPYFNYDHSNELRFKLYCCEKLYNTVRHEMFKARVANTDSTKENVDSI